MKIFGGFMKFNKILSLVLAVIVIMSVSGAVFAEASDDGGSPAPDSGSDVTPSDQGGSDSGSQGDSSSSDSSSSYDSSQGSSSSSSSSSRSYSGSSYS